MRSKVHAILLLLVIVSPSVAHAASFDRTLRVGSRGADVLELQKVLNKDTMTTIATAGPGSAGYETDFFGLKTAAAVKKFQEKYAADILTPAGLLRGTGLVGPATRTKLNALGDASLPPVSMPEPAPLPSMSPQEVSMAVFEDLIHVAPEYANHPNAKNLDVFLRATAKISQEQGVTVQKTRELLGYFKNTSLSTTTDFRARFISEVNAAATAQNPNWRLKVVSFFSRGIRFEFARRANAAVLPSFYGRITYVAYTCTCPPSIARLTIVPTDGKGTYILDYVPLTQGFRSYNLNEPEIIAMGLFLPPVPPLMTPCWQYSGNTCTWVPGSIGTVTPITGSTLTPR